MGGEGGRRGKIGGVIWEYLKREEIREGGRDGGREKIGLLLIASLQSSKGMRPAIPDKWPPFLVSNNLLHFYKQYYKYSKQCI